jgi:hypothetical protein
MRPHQVGREAEGTQARERGCFALDRFGSIRSLSAVLAPAFRASLQGRFGLHVVLNQLFAENYSVLLSHFTRQYDVSAEDIRKHLGIDGEPDYEYLTV